jgi:hypothetical protein
MTSYITLLKDVLIPLGILIVTAVLAVIASQQLRDLVRSIQSQTYQQIYATMIEIDRFFIDHPEMKPLFYPGEQRDGSIIDGTKISSVTEMLVDFFDSVYYQEKSMPPNTFKAYWNYILDIYSHSEAIRDFINTNSKWYPPDFVKALTGK